MLELEQEEFWKDVMEALHKSIKTFYDHLDKKGWDPNIAIKIHLYQISSDYDFILEELTYTNLGEYLPKFTDARLGRGKCESKKQG